MTSRCKKGQLYIYLCSHTLDFRGRSFNVRKIGLSYRYLSALEASLGCVQPAHQAIHHHPHPVQTELRKHQLMVPHEALLLLLVPHTAIHYSHHDHSPAAAPVVHVKCSNKPTNPLLFTAPENVGLNYWHSLMYNFNADTKKKHWYYTPSMQQTGLHKLHNKHHLSTHSRLVLSHLPHVDKCKLLCNMFVIQKKSFYKWQLQIIVHIQLQMYSKDQVTLEFFWILPTYSTLPWDQTIIGVVLCEICTTVHHKNRMGCPVLPNGVTSQTI